MLGVRMHTFHHFVAAVGGAAAAATVATAHIQVSNFAHFSLTAAAE